jgi:hypothetical protein
VSDQPARAAFWRIQLILKLFGNPQDVTADLIGEKKPRALTVAARVSLVFFIVEVAVPATPHPRLVVIDHLGHGPAVTALAYGRYIDDSERAGSESY